MKIGYINRRLTKCIFSDIDIGKIWRDFLALSVAPFFGSFLLSLGREWLLPLSGKWCWWRLPAEMSSSKLAVLLSIVFLRHASSLSAVCVLYLCMRMRAVRSRGLDAC